MIGLLILLVILCLYYNNTLQVVRYSILKEKIPKPFQGSRILLLSDLHDYEFGENNCRLIAMIQKENPDYIMISGDMLKKASVLSTQHTYCLLEQLIDKYPVYYAPGNHEEYFERNFSENGEYIQFVDTIKKMGVHYISNETVCIEKEQSTLSITGLSLPKRYFAKFYEHVELKKEDLENYIGKEKKGDYEILLAHNPNYFPVYAQWGADLVLSGHVHGGVVILPFLGGVISTTFQLFPKYDFGMFQEGKSQMILSKGLAVHTIKLRLFNKPEIAIIELG